MPDNDDVFDDFEKKLKDMDDEPRYKEEEPSEADRLKKEYEEQKKSLKEKFKRQKKNPEADGEKPKTDISLERVAYVSVIIILAAFILVDLSFFHGDDQKIVAKVVSDNPETEVVEEVQETEGDGAVEEVADIDEDTNKTDSADETVEPAIETEKALSGVVELTIDKIYTELVDEDMGHVNSVVFTVDNGKNGVLTPTVNVYVYDDELHESWITRSRGTFTYEIGLNAGDKVTGAVDLSPKTFRNLNLEKIVRVELNGTDGEFIAAKSESILIS
jgi:hypothetical protein